MILRINLSLLLNYYLIYFIAARNYHILFISNLVTLIITAVLFRFGQIRIYVVLNRIYIFLFRYDNMNCFKMFLNIKVLFVFEYIILMDVNLSTLLHFYKFYWPCAFYVNLFVSIKLLVHFYDG